MGDTGYKQLINKLDEFIRKYYLNKMLRGGIWSLGILLLSVLVFASLEYAGHFSVTVRTVLFYSFLLINLAIIYFMLGRYALAYFKLGRGLSYDEAALVIGRHFPEVKDKLLNTLQLQKMGESASSEENSLISASINQKTNELKPVPFSSAIRFGENKKYLKYAAVPLALILVVLVAEPPMLLEGSARIIEHRKFFEEKAPFEFVLVNDNLNALRQDDVELKLKLKGETLPAEAYLEVDGEKYLMRKQDNASHTYTLRNLQKDQQIQFYANGYYSRPFDLKVRPRPLLKNFEIKLNYPEYTGLDEQTRENSGDLEVPEGTRVVWKFKTENTDKVDFYLGGSNYEPERSGQNLFMWVDTLFESNTYYLKTANEFVQSQDSIVYYITTIPDEYPEIRVEKQKDSLEFKRLFFNGEISDDYGLSALNFVYEYTKSDDTSKLSRGAVKKSLGLKSSKGLQSFYHTWDLARIGLESGEQLQYYFEVSDNDAINGPKTSRSQTFTFSAPNDSELAEELNEAGESVKNKLKQAQEKASKLQKEAEEIRNKLLDQRDLNWEDRKQVKSLIQRQKELEESIEQAKKTFRETVKKQDDFKKLDEDSKEKMQDLYEKMEDVMSPEMKEMFEKLEKLLEKENKDGIEDQLQQLEKEDVNTKNDLDRMMELFKKLEFEQKMKENIDRLNKLSEKQEQLSEETKKGEKNSEELQEKQEKLKKEFDDIQKEMDKAKELNEQLKSPQEMEDTEQSEESIKQKQEESQQQLQKNNNQKAGEQQKKASDEMKEMAKKMQEQMKKMEMKSLEINYKKIRQILENLVHFSFEQERLLQEMKEIRGYNPRFVELAQEQSKLENDAEMIEDSLLALSKEVMQLESTITREIADVNFYMDKAKEQLSNRQINQVQASQQYIMTSTNNLAVLLSEVMDQMQMQMSQKMKGSQMCQQCKKPNSSGEGQKSSQQQMEQMKKMQEELSKRLEQMQEGKKPGKEGQEGKQGRNGAKSKELARIAEQQERIRQQMRALQEKLQKEGQKPGGNLNKLQELMEENEEDIVNKRITQELINRQKEIEIRMLEAEKAIKEQETDKKRESQTADNIFNPEPPSLEEYNKQKLKELELIQTLPPEFNTFYREKVKRYFQQLD